MFRRETNREFAQGLEIDRLANKIGDVALDAELAKLEANAEASSADMAMNDSAVLVFAIEKMKRWIHNLQGTVAEKDTAIGKWVKHSAELEAQIARLKDELAVMTAGAYACDAQVKALRPLIPDGSDIIADSGQRYADGRIKTKLRIIYENMYDATASRLGIANPSSRKTN